MTDVYLTITRVNIYLFYRFRKVPFYVAIADKTSHSLSDNCLQHQLLYPGNTFIFPQTIQTMHAHKPEFASTADDLSHAL